MRGIKFKGTANVMLNDMTLPSKNVLNQFSKETLRLDYKGFKVEGIKSIKDRIILMLYCYHKVLKEFDKDSNINLESAEYSINSRDQLK